MNANNELIEHLLSVDVIRDAEKTTKQSYNKDDTTQRLAGLNFVKRSQKLAKELKANSDTHRGMSYLDFINVVISEGFVPVYTESFQGGGYNDKPVTEAYVIFYHTSKGILLTAESFGASMINKAQMYYNWVPNPIDKEWQRATSAGMLRGLVWAGSHDIHEALRYKIELLQRKGYFCKWMQQPSMFLANYVEARSSKDFEMINRRKMNQLPEFVRNAILA